MNGHAVRLRRLMWRTTPCVCSEIIEAVSDPSLSMWSNATVPVP
jgi:hypothetical protein